MLLLLISKFVAFWTENIYIISALSNFKSFRKWHVNFNDPWDYNFLWLWKEDVISIVPPSLPSSLRPFYYLSLSHSMCEGRGVGMLVFLSRPKIMVRITETNLSFLNSMWMMIFLQVVRLYYQRQMVTNVGQHVWSSNQNILNCSGIIG